MKNNTEYILLQDAISLTKKGTNHPDHFELVADEDSDVREITSCINCLYLGENDCEDFFCQKGKGVKLSDIKMDTIPSNCPMLGKSLTFKWESK